MSGEDIAVDPCSGANQRIVFIVQHVILVFISLYEESAHPEVILKSIKSQSLPHREAESRFFEAEIKDLALLQWLHAIVLQEPIQESVMVVAKIKRHNDVAALIHNLLIRQAEHLKESRGESFDVPHGFQKCYEYDNWSIIEKVNIKINF